MNTLPKSPKETTRGMMYFPRLLDKIRLHARGELGSDYLENLGQPQSGDGMCCNFLRIDYAKLRERVLQGGSDDEVLDWCFEHGRAANDADVMVWNGFLSKLGWRDFATGFLEGAKAKAGIADRADVVTAADLIDYDEGRLS